jgi:hypothetical protein
MKITMSSFLFRSKIFLKRNMVLYQIIIIIKNKFFGGKAAICDKKSKICIEGFPSSSNTYVVWMFKELFPDTHVAHHTHAIANVKLAIKNKIPCVIIIRNPLDTLSSYYFRFAKESKINLDDALEYYISYYQGLIELYPCLKSINSIIISSENITKNYNKYFSFIGKKIMKTEVANDLSYQNDLVMNKIYSNAKNNPRDILRSSAPNKEKQRHKLLIKRKIMLKKKYNEIIELYTKVKNYELVFK